MRNKKRIGEIYPREENLSSGKRKSADMRLLFFPGGPPDRQPARPLPQIGRRVKIIYVFPPFPLDK